MPVPLKQGFWRDAGNPPEQLAGFQRFFTVTRNFRGGRLI